MKQKILFTTLLMVVFALVGCTTEVEQVSSSAEPKQETQKAAEPAKVYKIGDTVKVNGLEITIKSAKFTKPQQYVNTKNGKVLTLELQTNNKGETATFIDNTEFNLYDKDGNQLEAYFGYDELAISGDINTGKKKDGKLYFDVKESDKYELIYQPSFTWDGKEVKWEIQPQK